MRKQVIIFGGIGLLVVWSALLLAGGWLLGQRRIVHRMASPDGAWEAAVQAHASLDPPAQTLWLGRSGGPPERLTRLPEDQEWCDRIAWSGDGRRVAFLVNGVRLDVYSVPEGRLVGRTRLLPETADDGAREAREVRLSADGHSVRFADCMRGRARCDAETEIPLATELGLSLESR